MEQPPRPALASAIENDWDTDGDKWEAVQMGFKQVKDFLDNIKLSKHYDLLLSKGINYAWKIRDLTSQQLHEDFGLETTEVEAILKSSAELFKNEDIRLFRERFGDPNALLRDTIKGQELLKEHRDWPANFDEDRALTELEKWGISAEDLQLYNPEHLWASAGGCDGKLFLWPCENESLMPPCVRCVGLHTNPLTDFIVDWGKSTAISCGGDCKICIHDFLEDRDRPLGTIRNNSGVDVSQSFLSVDGDLEKNKAAVGTAGGFIKVGDIREEKIISVIKGHKDDVYQVKVDWNANQVVSCSWDLTVKTFDLRRGKPTRTMYGHDEICNRMDVSFEKQMALTVAWEEKIILWDLKKGMPIKAIHAEKGHAPNDVCVDWKTMKAATGADDGLVMIWDLNTGEHLSTIDCEHSQTLALDVDWGRERILTGSWDNQVKLFCLKTGTCLKRFRKARRTLTQCCLKK